MLFEKKYSTRYTYVRWCSGNSKLILYVWYSGGSTNVTIEDIARFHFEFERINPFQDGNGRIGRFIYLKQLLDNRLPLKYMNGESAKEYKKALCECSKENIKALVEYIESQNDFITENSNMF